MIWQLKGALKIKDNIKFLAGNRYLNLLFSVDFSFGLIKVITVKFNEFSGDILLLLSRLETR